MDEILDYSTKKTIFKSHNGAAAFLRRLFWTVGFTMPLVRHMGTEKLNSSAVRNSNLKSKLRSPLSYSSKQYLLIYFSKDSVLSLLTDDEVLDLNKAKFSSRGIELVFNEGLDLFI